MLAPVILASILASSTRHLAAADRSAAADGRDRLNCLRSRLDSVGAEHCEQAERMVANLEATQKLLGKGEKHGRDSHGLERVDIFRASKYLTKGERGSMSTFERCCAVAVLSGSMVLLAAIPMFVLW